MLSVEGLRKSYGEVRALVGVDLEIGRGEACCLIGPNGAGKTTLVSIVAGLLRPYSGSVSVGGIDALHDPFGARRLFGLAPQELAIYPIVTVRENISFFGELAGLRGALLERRVAEVAEVMELTDLMDRRGRDLSGGEKRRLHTAMAMVHRPPLLLLDEPTSGVDVSTRARLLEAVRSLAVDEGTAVCYSTHYLPEVEALDGTVAIIDRGRIIARGSVPELIALHAESAVELRFDGQPPALESCGRRMESDGEVVRFYTDEPAADAASVLATLGPDSSRLKGVEVVRAGLESVFLTLTGRRYAADEHEDRSGVVAS